MDPLSITTGATALVGTCYTVATAIYSFIDDTKNVDSNVSALCDEIIGLSKVLDSIAKSCQRLPTQSPSEIDPDGTLWSCVKTSLDDCKDTLQRLDSQVQEVQKSGFGWSFIRQSVKTFKLNMKMKDIVKFRQQIQTHCSGMQGALQMINVCLLISGQASQELVVKSLRGLENQMGRVELVLQSQVSLTPADRIENYRISNNMNSLLRAARNFHSAASSVASGSTTWGGSVMGEPLTREQFRDIEGWIPQPVTEEEEEEILNAAQRARNLSEEVDRPEPSQSPSTERSTERSTEPPPEQRYSDTDSDIEDDLTKKMEELALTKLKQKDYDNAEMFLRRIVDRNESGSDSKSDLIQIRLKLALTLCLKNQWSDAEEIILPMTAIRDQSHLDAFHIFHAIILETQRAGKLDNAEQNCKKVVQAKRKLLGRKNPSYFQSVALLASIYDSEDNKVDAEACRSLYPPNTLLVTDPGVYLQEVFGSLLQSKVAISQDSTTTTLISQVDRSTNVTSSNRTKILVAIDFGMCFTGVSMAAVVNGQLKRLHVTKWIGFSDKNLNMGSEDKMHSVLYYELPDRPRGWGHDIAEALAPTGYPKPGVKKLEWFKVLLFLPYFGGDIASNLPAEVLEKDPVDLTTVFFSNLRRIVEISIPSAIQEAGLQMYRPFDLAFYFLTPADLDIRKFKEAVDRAGMKGGPQAPPDPFIVRHRAAVAHCINVKDITVANGSVVTIADCGAAFVSLISYRVESMVPLKLYPLSNGENKDSCGATAIDRNFSNVVRGRIRKMKLPDGSRTAGKVYARCLLDFRKRIKTDFRNDGMKWAVDVGLEMDYAEAGIENGYMIYSNAEILSCFDPVFDRTIELIGNELKLFEQSSQILNTVVLIGGMAQSVVLLNLVKQAYIKPKVVRATEADFAAALGAIQLAYQDEIGVGS